MSARGGESARGCLPRGVGCLSRGVGLSAKGGVSAWGKSARGCLPRGVGVSARGVSARHPSVDRMTDRCKNITLPQLRCGR